MNERQTLGSSARALLARPLRLAARAAKAAEHGTARRGGLAILAIVALFVMIGGMLLAAGGPGGLRSRSAPASVLGWASGAGTSAHAAPAPKPSGPIAKPGSPAEKPGGPAAKPAAPAEKPGGPTEKPNGPVAKPAPPAPNSTEQATAELAAAGTAIDAVRADRTAMQGAADATTAKALLADADGLKQAGTDAQDGANYAGAVALARASREAADAARDLLRAGTGGTLPSDTTSSTSHGGAAAKPTGPRGAPALPPHLQGADQATIDAFLREKVGRDLRKVYSDLTTAGSAPAVAGTPPEASRLLTVARGLYRRGYERYTAGGTLDASLLASSSAHAARAVEQAMQATGAVPSPVAPPAGW